jgi:putative peptide zinc metalloprotease protein
MLMPCLAWVFSPFGILLWFLVVVSGAVIGVMNWGVLTDEVIDKILSAENLTVAGLVYPIVKALHELGHGLALRHLGLEVREIGILVAAFIPTPYVDASSSIKLERRRDRIFVAAAGMAVELFLGGIALMVWVGAEPGALRAICYNVVFISGFSTLLYNGNPLQRYDGYYILTDAIGVPSLGARSGQMIAGYFRKLVLGESSVPMPEATKSERALFLLYGPTSFVYRFRRLDQTGAAQLGHRAILARGVWPRCVGDWRGPVAVRGAGAAWRGCARRCRHAR